MNGKPKTDLLAQAGKVSYRQGSGVAACRTATLTLRLSCKVQNVNGLGQAARWQSVKVK